MKVQLNELKNDQDEAIAGKDFVRAQQLNLEMEQLKAEQERLQEELTEAAAMAAMPSASKAKEDDKTQGRNSIEKDWLYFWL